MDLDEQKEVLKKLIDEIPEQGIFEAYTSLIGIIAFYNNYIGSWNPTKENSLRDELIKRYPIANHTENI